MIIVHTGSCMNVLFMLWKAIDHVWKMLIIAMNRHWSCMITYIFMSSWTLSWPLLGQRKVKDYPIFSFVFVFICVAFAVGFAVKFVYAFPIAFSICITHLHYPFGKAHLGKTVWKGPFGKFDFQKSIAKVHLQKPICKTEVPSQKLFC